jgi:hypothetical protein
MREPVNECTTVQAVQPTKTTNAVKIIGIEAILAFRLRKNANGRRWGCIATSQGVCIGGGSGRRHQRKVLTGECQGSLGGTH